MAPPCSAPLRKMNDFALGLNHQTKSVCTEASRDVTWSIMSSQAKLWKCTWHWSHDYWWLMRSHRTVLEHASQCMQVMSLLGKSSLLNAGAIPLAMGGTAVSMVTDGVGSTIRGGAGLLGHLAMDEARVSMTYPWHIHHRSIILIYFTLPCSLAEVWHILTQTKFEMPTWPMQRGTACTTRVVNWINKAVKPSVCFDNLLPLLARYTLLYSWVGTFLSSHIVSSFSFHAPAGLQSATEDETGTERDHWGNWWLQGGWQFGCCWVLLLGKQCFFMFFHSCSKFNFTWDTLSSLCFSGL